MEPSDASPCRPTRAPPLLPRRPSSPPHPKSTSTTTTASPPTARTSPSATLPTATANHGSTWSPSPSARPASSPPAPPFLLARLVPRRQNTRLYRPTRRLQSSLARSSQRRPDPPPRYYQLQRLLDCRNRRR